MLGQAQEMQQQMEQRLRHRRRSHLRRRRRHREDERQEAGALAEDRPYGRRRPVGSANTADVEMLEDLIIAALNEAGRRADESLQSGLSGMLGGLNLPGF